MGQHQCPKYGRQFARSDSLRKHLTSGICSEDMESETMSENEESTMSEESDAETSRKTSLENMKIKIMVFMTKVKQTIMMKMMKTNIILEKKSKVDPWTFFVNGVHSILQDPFNEGVKHIIEKNPDIDTEKAEEDTFHRLEPRYRAEAIGQYKAFLKLSKAMKKDPLHKKITDTAKRLRDEDDFDQDDASRYAIKNEDTSWMANLKNLTHKPIA